MAKYSPLARAFLCVSFLLILLGLPSPLANSISLPAQAAPQPLESSSTRLGRVATYTRTYPLYEVGWATRVGDVNHDGLSDIVLTTNESRLRVWIQNAICHEVQEKLDIPMVAGSVDIAIADLNGDQLNDIAILSTGTGVLTFGYLTILYQTPSGFSTPVQYTSLGSDPHRMAVGDLNGDGRLDLVVSSSHNLDILRQQADGAFVDTAVSYSAVNRPWDVAIADFNGDGRKDIALQSSGWEGDPAVRLYNQNANGNFQFFADLPSPVLHPNVVGMAVGDVTGDGRADVMATAYQNQPYAQVFLYVQLPGGGMSAPTQIPTYDNPINPKLVDMNGDGRLDLALLNDGYGTYTVHYQQPGGGLGTGIQYPTNAEIQTALNHVSDFGDITGDGQVDLAYTSRNIGLAVVSPGTLPSCPVPPPPPPAAPPPPFSISQLNRDYLYEMVAADIDGDGQQEFLTLNTGVLQESTVLIAKAQPSGAYAFTGEIHLGQALPISTTVLSGLSVGDLNGDGRLDVAAGQPGYQNGNQIAVAFQGPNGTWIPNTAITIATQPVQTLIADYTGDHLADVGVLANGGFYVCAQQAGGTLGAPVLRAAGQVGPTLLARTVDWNGDGRMDVVAYSGSVRVFLQQADGSFQMLAPTAFNPVGLIGDLQVGDVNGDGRTDIVLSEQSNTPIGKLALVLQQPDGSLSSRIIVSNPAGYDMPGGLAILDLNGDNSNDILVMNGWPYFSVFTQNQAHMLDPVRIYDYYILNWYRPRSVAVALKQDGSLDTIGVATQDGYLLFLKPFVNPPVSQSKRYLPFIAR